MSSQKQTRDLPFFTYVNALSSTHHLNGSKKASDEFEWYGNW